MVVYALSKGGGMIILGYVVSLSQPGLYEIWSQKQREEEEKN